MKTITADDASETKQDTLEATGGRVRVFSYLPNPRLYKATIAARYSGAEIEIVGAAPGDLANMLWDSDPRELTPGEKKENPQWARPASMGFEGSLYKTDAFLAANPYGNVPAGFAGEDRMGVFESNSIMRAAARAGNQYPELYGPDWATQSRIDGFLDRTLLFADALQRYLLTRGEDLEPLLHTQTVRAFESYLTGIEAALERSRFIATDQVTLADIVFVCEIALLTNEHALRKDLLRLEVEPVLSCISEFPGAAAHLKHFAAVPQFTADLEKYFKRFTKYSWW